MPSLVDIPRRHVLFPKGNKWGMKGREEVEGMEKEDREEGYGGLNRNGPIDSCV